MRNPKIGLAIIAAAGLLVLPHHAKAVVPPDFVFNIATLAFQAFSIMAIFFATAFGSLAGFFRKEFFWLKRHPAILVSIIMVLLAFSAVGAYLYASSARKDAYIKWLKNEQTLQKSAANENQSP